MSRNIIKTIIISFVVLLCGSLFPTISKAQINVNIPGALKNELNMEIIPEYPRAYQNVYVNLSLYTDDLNSAYITWFNNGKVALEGTGKTSYAFRTGAPGEEVRIEVVVVLKNGISFNRFFSVNPASVDLVWEADSYVAPFYAGKALHSKQGSLKIVAFPEFYSKGKRIDSSNLIYSWYLNDEAIQSQSGYGKSSAVINGNLLGGTEKIYLLVRDPVTNITAESYLDIPTVDPQVLFYKNDPYYGRILEQSLANTYELKTTDLEIIATPFFMSQDGNNIQYDWKINGSTEPQLQGSRSAVFKKPDVNGNSLISIDITNPSKILQLGQGKLQIIFTK